MKLTKTLLAGALMTSLLACQSNNPPLTGTPPPPAVLPPPPERPLNEKIKDGLEVKFDPRVDILFVIDDSRSMEKHQANLSRNIQQFVDAFAKVKAIDFHIGFTVVHDRTRYGIVVPEKCADGRVNWDSPGTLQPLKGPALPDGRRYVTKDDDFRTVLRESLDPKKNTSLVKDLINPDPKNPSICPYGPEEEELFIPLLNALEDPTRVNGPNKGFRREGAFFVAILVSDAKDASGITPDEVVRRLSNVTGENRLNKKRFRVFSVAMKPGTKISESCKPDPAFANQKVTADGQLRYIHRYGAVVGNDENPLAILADMTADSAKSSQVLSICDSNYGTTLARFGAQVQQDALSDMVIELNSRPEVTNDESKKLRVFLGDTELKENAQWSYNPNSVSVTVYAQKVDWDAHPKESVRVVFTPADGTSPDTKLIEL